MPILPYPSPVPKSAARPAAVISQDEADNALRGARRNCPWGAVQQAHELAPGIVEVECAGHGGIYLSPTRRGQFRAAFPAFKPFISETWLEQDNDATLAFIAFPESAQPRAGDRTDQEMRLFLSVRKVREQKDDYYASVLPYFTTAAGKALAERTQAYAERERLAEKWEIGSMGTDRESGGWMVWLRRSGDEAKTVRVFPHYPEKSFHTDAEVSQMTEIREDGSRVACAPVPALGTAKEGDRLTLSAWDWFDVDDFPWDELPAKKAASGQEWAERVAASLRSEFPGLTIEVLAAGEADPRRKGMGLQGPGAKDEAFTTALFGAFQRASARVAAELGDQMNHPAPEAAAEEEEAPSMSM